MLALATDDRMLAHEPGAGHPERPDRLRATVDALMASGITILRVPIRAATPDELRSVHAPDHVDRMLALDGRYAQLDADTAVSPRSIEAALLAAGGTLALVETLVAPEGPTRGFALVRPPGHHAEHDRAMGFCLFGNIAIAAAHAIDRLGLGRVLIVDWDVHHGNGTQHLLEERGDILVVNLHQERIYPHTGAATETGRGAGIGATLNVPLPGGSGGPEYLAAMREVVVPAADSFRPNLVLVSAGFDGHVRDPLAGQMLTSADFGEMCSELCAVADRHCGGRIGLVLEGGYDLVALEESVVACAESMQQ